MFGKKLIKMAMVGVVAAVAMSPMAAAAKTCWNVKFTITNNSSDPVSLRMIYFVDKANKPRKENVPNKELLPGQSYKVTSTLRKVGGEKFKTQVSYKALIPRKNNKSAKWSSTRRTSLKSQGKCKSKKSYSMEIK